MKFDDVIVNEAGFMQGMKNLVGGPSKKQGAQDQARGKSPSIGGGGITYVDKLAKQIFIQDFVSDALSSVQSGLQSGLILPPAGQQDKDDDSNIDVDGKDKDGRLIPGFLEKMYRAFNPNMTNKEAYGRYVVYKGNPGALNKMTGEKDKQWQPYTIKKLKQGGYPANPDGMTDQEILRAYPGWNRKLDESFQCLDYKYVQLNTILEDIITHEQAEQTSQVMGRSLGEFLTDWFGQYMTGIDIRMAKPLRDDIIARIQADYDASKNPQRPNVNRELIVQLANMGWSAGKSRGLGGVSTDALDKAKGAQNAPGKAKVDAEKKKQQATEPETQTQTQPETQPETEPKKEPQVASGAEYSPIGKTDEEVRERLIVNYPRGATLQSGGQTYTWVGARWMSKETGRIATVDMRKKLNLYALGQLERGDVGAEDYRHLYKKPNVAESLTFSSLRAEKIALLQTR